ncbi:anti-sigma regulatory factor (Ser/Thr protein kinase) [Streptomyces spectabilis]|uniref:Anti-sigma regulatory factor (Ser/Thr protein kinase) n=2 Tax=Streptomyces spectabilis TaxID=68270 RepID=A0A7W8AWL3_STRST|nr:anti-sigma regulatory factor (Ser/Thr protein kinase) [Streptomyces spectabilis]
MSEPLGGMILYPVPESVGRARRWFRTFTESLHLGCSVVDDCVLMVSELVTNAVLYGRADGPWRVRVDWYRVGGALRVEVHNPGCPAHVRLRSPSATEAHGRGLLLVDALADEWWSAPSRHGGTLVAFVVHQAFKPD